MSVDNTIVIPVCEREPIRILSGREDRIYTPEGTWTLGPSFAEVRIAIQCSQIDANGEIVAGIDWSVDGRNWTSELASDATFFPSGSILNSPNNYMSASFRPVSGDVAQFGPYTRFWVALMPIDPLGATDLTAMITATVIARTV